MFYVLGLLAVGMVAYVAVENARDDVPKLQGRRLALGVREHRLIVEDFDRDEARYFHFSEIDYLAVHMRGARRRCVWLFGFGEDRLRFREGTRGLNDVISYILATPPKGADLSLYGEAMEARDEGVWVLLDRTPGDIGGDTTGRGN